MVQPVAVGIYSCPFVRRYFKALASKGVPPVKDTYEDVSGKDRDAVTKGKLQVLHKQVNCRLCSWMGLDQMRITLSHSNNNRVNSSKDRIFYRLNYLYFTEDAYMYIIVCRTT